MLVKLEDGASAEVDGTSEEVTFNESDKVKSDASNIALSFFYFLFFLSCARINYASFSKGDIDVT